MENLRERIEALEHHARRVERRLRRWRGIACSLVMLGLLSASHPSQAADFSCTAGDVACLIKAITLSNANGEVNTIRLEAGTYTLTAPFEGGEFVGVGLPTITSTLTIQGASGTTTVIERAATAALFGLLDVAESGNLTLAALTLQDGARVDSGAGVRNLGILAVIDSVIKRNEAIGHSCAGIASFGPTLTVTRSTITENSSNLEAGGGLCVVGGAALILQSSIVGNRAGEGGGIRALGSLTVQNSTIAKNSASRAGGGVFVDGGSVTFINSTISQNRDEARPGFFDGGGGITVAGASFISLINTILAGNVTPAPGRSPDCVFGFTVNVPPPGFTAVPPTSFGNNLIGDPTGCNITLRSGDLTGDPGLRQFRDNGTPGNGHFPLLATSQAIDAGVDSVCPRIDQLGRRRVGPCDIGAIRFRGERQVDP